VIGLYYYLRVITTLFSPPNDINFPSISPAGHLVLGVVATGILFLGIFPEGIVHLIAQFPGF